LADIPENADLTKREKRVIKSLPPLKQILDDNVEVLSPEEVDLLASQAANSFSGRRNVEMIDFMVRTGARVGATIWIRKEDLNLEDRTVKLQVTKDDSDRTLKIDPRHVNSLKNYLEDSNFPDSQWLFPALNGSKVTTRYVRKFMSTYARKAGLSPIRVHPHLLRHTFASRFLAVTNNIVDLKKALGHDSLLSTFVYLHDVSRDQQPELLTADTFDLARIADDLPRVDRSKTVA
jgi:site-specific recombinase XerD